jgi:hypothetical protein
MTYVARIQAHTLTSQLLLRYMSCTGTGALPQPAPTPGCMPYLVTAKPQPEASVVPAGKRAAMDGPTCHAACVCVAFIMSLIDHQAGSSVIYRLPM